jgi:mannose/cellobiose epimerase-like protein (N-acyl-D-glucosamine 2-epimerase family)
MPDMKPLADAFTTPSLASWLLDGVCPFWTDTIVDPAGGFFEGLDARGRPLPGIERSMLNQARLTYVFSHAYCLRAEPRFLHAAVHGFRYLQQAATLARTGSGWHRVTALDGSVPDATCDAYDHAFVILAMAWHYRATQNPEALVLADEAYGFLQDRLCDPDHGGFHEAYPFAEGSPKLPRRQNPHMHLLESCLAMVEATGHPVWLERGTALVDLFKQRFLDPHSDTVIEFFAVDWTPAAGSAGERREPGHSFEWVWLLLQYFRHTGDAAVVSYADRLFVAATYFGIDHDDGLGGLVVDAIDANGEIVEGSKLLWPQTEYIKACLARAELRQDAQAGAVALAHIDAMRRHFFRPDGVTWTNQLTRDGVATQDITPARVLYHLFLALAEAVRVTEPQSTRNDHGS